MLEREASIDRSKWLAVSRPVGKEFHNPSDTVVLMVLSLKDLMYPGPVYRAVCTSSGTLCRVQGKAGPHNIQAEEKNCTGH